ncbi:hypothetical protein HPB50_028123 [Hyalomma asiaticum]|nr:hypothetical protein HPB50_028123 [Hyalomma asiaticum]
MAPVARILVASGAVLCFFLRLVVCQLEPQETGNSTPKCACATSTPIHINEDGVHRCVRASSNGNDMFTIAPILALAVAVLLVAAGYACGKGFRYTRRSERRKLAAAAPMPRQDNRRRTSASGQKNPASQYLQSVRVASSVLLCKAAVGGAAPAAVEVMQPSGEPLSGRGLDTFTRCASKDGHGVLQQAP